MIGITFNTILVGAEPSVVQAAIMGGLSLLAIQPGGFYPSGLPSPEILQAFRNYSVLHAHQNGWIELTIDGEQMWV